MVVGLGGVGFVARGGLCAASATGIVNFADPAVAGTCRRGIQQNQKDKSTELQVRRRGRVGWRSQATLAQPASDVTL